MKKYLWVLLLLLPVVLLAQDAGIPADLEGTASVIPNAGYFFASLVAGVILAIAFQLILTNLSVAAGLNVLGTVTSGKNNNKKAHSNQNYSQAHDDDDSTLGDTVQKISSAFGIWTMVTASIALFFASWLATELSLTLNTTVGAVLGLVIWGLFYVAMMTIEVNALSSLVGSLIKMATSGFRAAYDVTASLFTKSPETKMADTAAKVAGAVREELFGDVDADDVKDQIQYYINQVKPKPIDPQNIRKELEALLNETEIKAIVDHREPVLDHDTIIASLRTKGINGTNARAIASGVQDAISKIKEESSSDKDKVSKIADASMRVAGLSSEQAEAYRVKIENYLKSTGKEELNPDDIKRDIELMFSDPQAGKAALSERLAHIDKGTIASIIAQRQDMSQEEAEKIVDRVEMVIGQLTGKAGSIKDSVAGAKDSAVEKIKNYLESLDNPALDYDGLQRDVQRLFHDPKAGADSLMRRLKSVDRDTLKQILASRKDISEEDAERIISRIEGVRDNLLGKAEQMKVEIERRIEEAKREALHQADEARKTAATAAWWAFGTAVISGIFSVLGGVVASNTF